MKKRDTFTPSPAVENVDSLWKECRHCGKRFLAKHDYYICCSWNCTQAHKQAMNALDKLEAEYKGHPF